jgi:phosphoribosylamine-glycine ligase
LGTTLQDAIHSAYANTLKISWEGVQFRNDIGQDLLKLEK